MHDIRCGRYHLPRVCLHAMCVVLAFKTSCKNYLYVAVTQQTVQLISYRLNLSTRHSSGSCKFLAAWSCFEQLDPGDDHSDQLLLAESQATCRVTVGLLMSQQHSLNLTCRTCSCCSRPLPFSSSKRSSTSVSVELSDIIKKQSTEEQSGSYRRAWSMPCKHHTPFTSRPH